MVLFSVPKSFCLTAVSSAVSIGLAPAILSLFTRSWTYETLHIALWPLAFTLLLHVMIPSAGYLIKKTSVYFARYIEMVGCIEKYSTNMSACADGFWKGGMTMKMLLCHFRGPLY